MAHLFCRKQYPGNECIIISVLIRGAYPSSLNDPTSHDNSGNTLFPNHPPKVRNGVVSRSCGERRRIRREEKNGKGEVEEEKKSGGERRDGKRGGEEVGKTPL